jgi:hypothetical protein
MRTYTPNWPFNSMPHDPPSAADLEQDERDSRRRAEQARRRQRAARLAAGLPEVELPTPENGFPF